MLGEILDLQLIERKKTDIQTKDLVPAFKNVIRNDSIIYYVIKYKENLIEMISIAQDNLSKQIKRM